MDWGLVLTPLWRSMGGWWTVTVTWACPGLWCVVLWLVWWGPWLAPLYSWSRHIYRHLHLPPYQLGTSITTAVWAGNNNTPGTRVGPSDGNWTMVKIIVIFYKPRTAMLIAMVCSIWCTVTCYRSQAAHSTGIRCAVGCLSRWGRDFLKITFYIFVKEDLHFINNGTQINFQNYSAKQKN